MPGAAEGAAPATSASDGSGEGPEPSPAAATRTRSPPARSAVAAHERVARIVGSPLSAAGPWAGRVQAAKPRGGERVRKKRRADQVKAKAAEAQGARASAPATAADSGRRRREETRVGAGVPVEGAALATPAAPAPAHDTRGRAPRATPTQKQGKSGGNTLQHGGGPRPGVLRLFGSQHPKIFLKTAVFRGIWSEM